MIPAINQGKRWLIIFFLLFSLFSSLTADPSKMIFIEQIYQLYESNLHQTQVDHKRNIFWLENSLKLPNIHPSMALVVTKTWEEYVKYKILLRFNIHFLLTKEYTAWGWEFDKKDVVFYNMEWAEDLKKSFEIARSRYKMAQYYWQETKKWSKLAYSKKVQIGWDQIEDLNWEIENNQYDYDYDIVLEKNIKQIDEKLKKIEAFMQNQ